ncbi:hypothetical protein ACH5RR_037879 [Cinchona calisaya]|uniref:Photosynthetic NDH subcomplex L 3 n=1 Tax=Cinchona calisaya TaxID=153742 RepID=A0ABD2YB42_9GENT
MARAANLSSIFEALSAIPKLHEADIIRKKVTLVNFETKNTQEIQENQLQTTRRLAIGLASLALFSTSRTGISLAEDNGFWLTTPIPVPSAKNKITNEDTGTRSFLKKGIYIANIGTKGRMLRLKKSAFDLLALEDLIGPDTFNYVLKYLRLKSTFMYFDFDELITAAAVPDKQSLTDLANRLFDSVEKLEDVAKQCDLPQTQSVYQDTTVILQEVMDRMA